MGKNDMRRCLKIYKMCCRELLTAGDVLDTDELVQSGKVSLWGVRIVDNQTESDRMKVVLRNYIDCKYGEYPKPWGISSLRYAMSYPGEYV